jgi:hypothetical protein
MPARLAPAALALLTLALAPPAAAEEDGGSRSADVQTVAGTIAAVAWSDGRFTVTAADGPVTLRVDRNTTVYLESRLGTIRDLVVGLPVRASYGPGQRAAWVEVRAKGVMPTPRGDAPDGGVPGGESAAAGAPDGGTPGGPPTLPDPSGGRSDGGAATAAAGASDGGSPAARGDDVPAGPASPEPNPGGRPERPGQPTAPPTGPSPVPGGPPPGKAP